MQEIRNVVTDKAAITQDTTQAAVGAKKSSSATIAAAVDESNSGLEASQQAWDPN